MKGVFFSFLFINWTFFDLKECTLPFYVEWVVAALSKQLKPFSFFEEEDHTSTDKKDEHPYYQVAILPV